MKAPAQVSGRRGSGEEHRVNWSGSSRTKWKEGWGKSEEGAANAKRQSGTGGRGTISQVAGRAGEVEGRRVKRCSGAAKKEAPRKAGEAASFLPNSGRRWGRVSAEAMSAAEGEGTRTNP